MLKYLGLFLLAGHCQAISDYYMDVNCGQDIDFGDSLGQIELNLTQRSTYQPNMTCTLTCSASWRRKFMLYFKSMDIESSSNCTRDWLDVRDGIYPTWPYVSGINRKLCGFNILDSLDMYSTSGPTLYLIFHSDGSIGNSGFQMIITSYHTGMCSSNEYDCDNGRCINDKLKCNGYNPCGDDSDCPLTDVAKACIVVGSVIFVVIVICAFIYYKKNFE